MRLTYGSEDQGYHCFGDDGGGPNHHHNGDKGDGAHYQLDIGQRVRGAGDEE